MTDSSAMEKVKSISKNVTQPVVGNKNKSALGTESNVS